MSEIRLRNPFTFFSFIFCGIALSVLPLGVEGQDGSADPSLQAVVRGFMQQWDEGDAKAVVDLVAKDGITLALDEVEITGVGARAVEASLIDLFDRYGGVETSLISVRDLGGDPAQAFAELDWTVLPKRTSERLTYTVFVAFVLEEGGWKVSELRVLR